MFFPFFAFNPLNASSWPVHQNMFCDHLSPPSTPPLKPKSPPSLAQSLHQPPNLSPLLTLFSVFWTKQSTWPYEDIHYAMFLHRSKLSKTISLQLAENPKSMQPERSKWPRPRDLLMTTVFLVHSIPATLSPFLFIKYSENSPAFHLSGLEYLSFSNISFWARCPWPYNPLPSILNSLLLYCFSS